MPRSMLALLPVIAIASAGVSVENPGGSSSLHRRASISRSVVAAGCVAGGLGLLLHLHRLETGLAAASASAPAARRARRRCAGCGGPRRAAAGALPRARARARSSRSAHSCRPPARSTRALDAREARQLRAEGIGARASASAANPPSVSVEVMPLTFARLDRRSPRPEAPSLPLVTRPVPGRRRRGLAGAERIHQREGQHQPGAQASRFAGRYESWSCGQSEYAVGVQSV